MVEVASRTKERAGRMYHQGPKKHHKAECNEGKDPPQPSAGFFGRRENETHAQVLLLLVVQAVGMGWARGHRYREGAFPKRPRRHGGDDDGRDPFLLPFVGSSRPRTSPARWDPSVAVCGPDKPRNDCDNEALECVWCGECCVCEPFAILQSGIFTIVLRAIRVVSIVSFVGVCVSFSATEWR